MRKKNKTNKRKESTLTHLGKGTPRQPHDGTIAGVVLGVNVFPFATAGGHPAAHATIVLLTLQQEIHSVLEQLLQVGIARWRVLHGRKWDKIRSNNM